MEEYIIHIQTHDGIFHADEVMAIALLKAYHFSDPIAVYRTRKQLEDINYTVDVGGEYNPDKGQFDHHQEAYQGELSSCGMVLQYLETKYFRSNELLDHLVRVIDYNDIGKVKSDSLFVKAIQLMNHPDISSKEQEGNFYAAIEFAEYVIDALKDNRLITSGDIAQRVEQIVSLVLNQPAQLCATCGDINGYRYVINENQRAKKAQEVAIADAIAKAVINGDEIRFAKGDVFIPVVDLIGKAHVGVQWDATQSCWSIQTIPLSKNAFGSKYLLEPVGDELFIHKAGFISKTVSGEYRAILIQ